MASYIIGKLLTLVGLMYAVYRSFKVLKVSSSTNAEATRMLMLWVALAFNALFEQYAEFLISWAPFYFELKCGILVWMLLPGSSGPGWVFNNLIHPGIRYGRYRAHKDIKPIATHALTQTKLAAQFALLSSTVSGLGARQLRSVEAALAANVAALDSELARRASGGAVSGAELLAEGPAAGLESQAPQSRAGVGATDSSANGRAAREAVSPRASGRVRRASAASASTREAGEMPPHGAALAYAQPGGGAMAWLAGTGSALAEAMGVRSSAAAAPPSTAAGDAAGDEPESKKEL